MGLDVVELAMEIENHYDIQISDKEWSEVERICDIQALIIKHLDPQKATANEVLEKVISLVSERSGIDENEILPTDSITNDLGLD